MNELHSIVENALAEPLGAARSFSQSGGRVVGYVGAEVPVELLVASHVFPVRLAGDAQASTVTADRYLESGFSPLIRSIAEQYLRGQLDFLDAIVLPRSNDSAQRLYYYLSELRRQKLVAGPDLMIYDLAKIPRDTSIVHSRAATRRLAAELGLDGSALGAAIAQRNRRRELFSAAARLRAKPNAVRGSVIDRIFRASDYDAAEVFDAAFAHWLRSSDAGVLGPRILLTGSAPSDERLHASIEAAGGNVVGERGEHPSCALALTPIAADATLDAISDHYQLLADGSRAFVNRAALTSAAAVDTTAEGVVIWLLEEEDALIWDLPAQLSALHAAGIPALPLVRRRWAADDGSLEEIATFTRGLRGAT
jgi:benzoyl-CoA reductase/2-hydroxyglutaryl-CoA dehydratase subunit BcrC/BadD/HgdB